MIPYLETENSSFQPIIPLLSNPGPECDPKSRKSGPRTTFPHSQSRPCAQLSNGYKNMIPYLETKIFFFQPIIPLHSNTGPEGDPKSRKSIPGTTCPRSQSIPRAQFLNGYPNMITYLETKNYAFQPIIPLRSNTGPECDPNLIKSDARTTHPLSQSRPRAQLSNGYKNMIPYLEMENSSFQPIIPLCSNSGPECDPKLRKSGPRTTRPSSQSRPRAQLSNGYPNMIPYLEMQNSTFQSIIPLRSNSGPECDSSSRKSGPITTRSFLQSRPRAQLSNGYPNMIPYLEMENFSFKPIIPLCSIAGPDCDPKSRKSGTRATRPCSQLRPHAQLSNGYANMIPSLEIENSSFQPIIPLHSNLGPQCDLKLRNSGRRTTFPRSQSIPCAQLSNGYPNMIPYLEIENFSFQPIIPLCSNLGPKCDPKSRKSSPRTTHPRS
jgi:hypothetical protein